MGTPAHGEVHHLRRRARLHPLPGRPGLGDVPVLAEPAAQVAAHRPEGQDLGPGEEVVERLLLDGVHRETGALPVGEQDHLAALVLPDRAESGLPVAEQALPGAEGAAKPAVPFPLEEARGRGGGAEPRLSEGGHPSGIPGPSCAEEDAPPSFARRRPRWGAAPCPSGAPRRGRGGWRLPPQIAVFPRRCSRRPGTPRRGGARRSRGRAGTGARPPDRSGSSRRSRRARRPPGSSTCRRTGRPGGSREGRRSTPQASPAATRALAAYSGQPRNRWTTTLSAGMSAGLRSSRPKPTAADHSQPHREGEQPLRPGRAQPDELGRRRRRRAPGRRARPSWPPPARASPRTR